MRPVVTGLTAPATFVEGGAAIRLAPAATISDDTGLRNGRIVVRGLAADDRVSLHTTGADNTLDVIGNELVWRYSAFNWQVIGQIRGGSGTNFTIDLNNFVQQFHLDAVMANLTYRNVSDALQQPRTLYIDVLDSEGLSVALASPGGFVALAQDANPFAALGFGDHAAPAAVDLNGDRDADLVVGSGINGALYRLINNLDGSFTLQPGEFNDGWGSGGDFQTPTAADINGDGRTDIVMANVNGHYRSWRTGDFPGFGIDTQGLGFPQTANPSHTTPSFIDLNGDGRLDMVIGDASGQLSVFRGQFGGGFSAVTSIFPDYAALGERYSAVVFHDVDYDGDLDALVTTTAGLHYLRNDGAYVFTEVTGVDNPFDGLAIGGRSKLAFLDVNADGAPDLVVGTMYGTLDVFLSTARYGLPVAVTIQNVNDTPTIDLDPVAPGSGVATTYVENADPLTIAPAALAIDADMTDFAGGTLTVQIGGTARAEDRLAVRDDGTAPGQIGLSGNTILYGGTAIGTLVGAGTNTLRIDLIAAADNAAVQALTQAITYANTSAMPSTVARTIGFTLSDGDGATSTTAVAIVAVTAVDDPTVITGPGRSPPYVLQRGTYQTIGTGITVTDTDGIANGPLTIRADLVSGRGDERLQFDSSLGTVTAVFRSQTGTYATISPFAGDLASLQAAAESLSMLDNSINQDASNKTIRLTLFSGTTAITSTTINVQSRASSNSPLVLLDGVTLGQPTRDYVENTGASALAPVGRVLDGDGDDFFLGDVAASISNARAGDRLVLLQTGGITHDGSTVSYNGQAIGQLTLSGGSTTLVVRLNGGLTVGTVEVLMRALAFENTSDAPVAGGRLISVSVSDGAGGASSNSITLNVRPVDDAPVLANLPVTLSIAGYGATAIAPAVTLSDVDGNAGGTVTVSGLVADDVVAVRHQGTGAGQIGVSGSTITYGGATIGSFTGGNATTLTITLAGATSDAAMQALIRSLTFENARALAVETRTLILNVTGATGVDLGDSAGVGSPHGRAITVSIPPRTNAPTVLDLNGADGTATLGASATYTENAPRVAIAPNAVIFDVDSSVGVNSLMVSITGGLTADDRLSVLSAGNGAGQVGVSGSTINFAGIPIASFSGGADGSPLTITFFAGTDVVAAQAVVRAVAYSNTSDAPSTDLRTVSFVAGFAIGSASATATIAVTAVDDPTVFLTGARYFHGIVENAPAIRLLPDATITDVDSSAPVTEIRVTRSLGADANDRVSLLSEGTGPGQVGVAGGDVLWGGVKIGTVAGGSGTSAMVVTFTSAVSADIAQSVVRAVMFDVPGDAPSGNTRGITVALTTPSGIVSREANVNVTAVNDAPIIDLDGGNPATTGVTLGYIENAVATQIAPSATFSDPDTAFFYTGLNMRVAVTENAWASDRLTIMTTGGVGVSGSNVLYNSAVVGTFTGGTGTTPLVISFTGNSGTGIDVAGYEAVMRAIGYANVSDAPAASVTISFSGNAFQGGFINATTTANATVAITPVDDPTLLDLHLPDGPGATSVNAQYTEGGVPIAIAASGGLYDIDSPIPNLQSLTVSYRVNATADDRLSVIAGGGVTVGGGVVSFGGQAIGTVTGGTGTASLVIAFHPGGVSAAVGSAIIKAIGFSNVSTDPSTASRGLTFTGEFVGGTTLSSDAAISVTAVNSLPVAVNDIATVAENAVVSINVLANDTDVDGPAPSVVQINRTFLAIDQVMQLGSGARVSIAANGTVRYDTNGMFSALAAGATATDSFAYTLAGGVEATVMVTITGVDTAPVALSDLATVAENASVAIDVLANDNDIDGPAPTIATIAGIAATVGQPVTLASGARVTLTADGRLLYDANGAFDHLVSAATALATGAANSQATDSVRYTLAGGVETTLTVTITGVDGANDQLRGGAGADTITGTSADDFINVATGGSDVVTAGSGNDAVFVGAAFDTTDRIDGGAGALDQIGVQGDYASQLVLGSNTVRNVEMLVFLPGSDTRFGAAGTGTYSYNIKTHDDTVAQGSTLTVQANTLRATESLTFDGSAETNGSFTIFGGLGRDTLTGGQRDDGFYFGPGRFNASDSVDGQGGTMDQIGLQGDYAGANAIVFGAGQITGIEGIVLLSGADTRFGGGGLRFGYTLTMHDDNAVGAGPMIVQGNSLRADEVLTLDASAETATPYRIFGGAGADVITGGGGNDEIWGRAGADTLRGGGGNDVFAYLTGDSTAAARDTIADFDRGDIIDLARLPLSRFIGGDAFSAAGQVRATAQGAGNWLIEGDVDGDGTADLSILVTAGAAFAWTAADFRLVASADASAAAAHGHALAI